jgi:hypothetical protein
VAATAAFPHAQNRCFIRGMRIYMSLGRFQLNSRLIDGMSSILAYARAYRPMALSSSAVVRGAESAACGQAAWSRSE